jgi:hypothetical protein
MHAAQTDRLTNTLTILTLPTIWDRLKAKGVSARYFRSDFLCEPIATLCGTEIAP